MSSKGEMLHTARAIGLNSRDADRLVGKMPSVTTYQEACGVHTDAQQTIKHLMEAYRLAVTMRFPKDMLHDTNATLAMLVSATRTLEVKHQIPSVGPGC